MAINRALLPQQLEAGAPDLRLTGDQSHRGTYTQRRRNQMAGGGIASMRDRIKYNVGPGETLVGKPGGIVEPGVEQYGILSKIKDKIVDDLIPNEIKENPMATALVGGALVNQLGLPDIITRNIGLGEDVGQNWLGELLGAVVPGDTQFDTVLGNENPFIIGGGVGDYNWPLESTVGTLGDIASTVKGGLTNFLDPNYYLGKIGLQTKDGASAYNADGTPRVRWMEPLAIGTAMGAADAATRKDYQLPADLTIDPTRFATAQAAIDDPNLRFKPIESARLADGGRIGYQNAGPVDIPENLPTDDYLKKWEEFLRRKEEYDKKIRMAPKQEVAQGGRIGYSGGSTYQDFLADKTVIPHPDDKSWRDVFYRWLDKQKKADGGRVAAQEGGLMDLGGMEKDYRNEGGFVPIGGEEKADDVPARLSKNEFVFTADAVRNAGGGDIDKGAEVMENLMENLEAGGKVSEDSQGLEGAQAMFANTQRLENRII